MNEAAATTTPAENPEVRYERRDIRVRPIVLFGVALALLAAVVHVAMWLLFDLFFAREQREQPPSFPLAAPLRELSPIKRVQRLPEPRLERLKLPEPGPDIGRWRKPDIAAEQVAAEEKRLSSFGWVDEQQGIAHIPIDEAIRLLENRLPARSASESIRGGDR